MRHSPLASGLSPLVPLIFLLAVSYGSCFRSCSASLVPRCCRNRSRLPKLPLTRISLPHDSRFVQHFIRARLADGRETPEAASGSREEPA